MKQTILFLTILSLSLNCFGQKTDTEFTNPDIQMGMVVSDLDASLHFYTAIIGMVQTGSFDVKPEKARQLGLTDGKELNVTVLRLKDSEASNQLKIMSFGNKYDMNQKQYINDDLGVQYFTIYPKSLKPVLERIKENDIPMLGDTPVKLNEKDSFIMIQDPDGTFIELIGPMN
ncbi:MAG: VOC family protein [bacterium]